MKKYRYIVFLFLLAFVLHANAQDTLSQKRTENPIHLAYRVMDQQRLVGAVDVVTSDQLGRSLHYKASNALPGLAAGLYATKGSAEPGAASTALKVRGLSRGGNDDAPLMVVDGIPNRAIDNLPIEAIASITILKDITAKMLYGSQAANGVILVTTKRGLNADKQISFSVEGGLKMPTFKAQYLDAATYAQKYNQAQANDGLSPLYQDADIKAYQDGTDPLHYPDVDYYSTFIRDFSDYQKYNASLRGGDEIKSYFLDMNYVHESGIENVGSGHQFDQLNLLSNLDYKVNDVISASLDMSVRLGLNSKGIVNGSRLYEALSSHRPNDYPLFVTQGQHVDTDSLAYNTKGGGNLYGDMTRSGYQRGQDFQTQTAMNLDFDLSSYIIGLSARVKFGFDSFNSIYKGKWLQYATHKVESDGSLVRVGEDEVKGSEQRFYDNFVRNFTSYGVLNYDRTFGQHAILADASLLNRKYAFKSVMTYNELQQDNTGVNAGLRINYAYSNKYIVELNSSYMGTDRLQRGDRFKLFGALGAAWLLSEEDFLKESTLVNDLKLKASYGTMGYDKALAYYQYIDEYSGYNAYYTGTNNALVNWGQRISQIGNSALTFEESTEFNIGVESSFLAQALRVEANYFNELREGMPVAVVSKYPGYVADVAPSVNYNSVRNQGFDFSLNYSNAIGDLYYALGANVMYSKAVYEAYDEFVVYDHLSVVGQATDVYLGLKANGLYADQAAIDAHGVSSAYGQIRPGDIRYDNKINDLNDNLIDQYDVQAIGHTFPRINYSLNLNLAYKGFDLYVLGQGVSDVDKMLSNSYFMNYGEGKYSKQALAADYPRLTANTSGGHSFIPSSYWMQNGAYFKIRTAELSYTLPVQMSQKINAENVKIYLRGSDLLTFSSISSVDPEDVDAGVSKYPLFTTLALGAKVTF